MFVEYQKQRRMHRRKIAAVCTAALLVLAAAAGFLLWMLMPRTMSGKLASAKPPEGSLYGLRINSPRADGTLPCEAMTPEESDAYFADAAMYARTHGLNALLFDVTRHPDAGIGFRVRGTETWTGAAADDTLFRKYDPLWALCETASEKGLPVYAVIPADASGPEWEKALGALKKRYAVAGILTQGETLSGESGEILMLSEEAFDHPAAYHPYAAGLSAAPALAYDYAACLHRPDEFSVLASGFSLPSQKPVLLGYTPEAKLSVGYPADGAKIYTQTCYLTGTSDPDLPLTFGGEPVETRAPGGTFGILAAVAPGENTYTFAQGDTSVSVTVTRPTGGGSWGGGRKEHDATIRVEEGTPVRIENWITSLLYDPASDGNINETVRRGAIARVTECAETERRGKKTWAYRLESGDYVLAYNVSILPEATPRASFTGAVAESTPSGETVTFTGSGTPLAYTNMVDGELVMDFYDADFAAGFAAENSAMIESVRTEANESFTRVTFSFTQPVWGHSVEYTDGTTQILLKKQPVRSGVFGRPLEGVTVLLDAGHGDQDNGAPGAAGPGAPCEKDANLALMHAAKYRLEQMGASVQTIRTDDTFLSLEERNRAIITGQPDFFVSIHHNSIDLSVNVSDVSGVECYYFYPASKPLAESLVENFCAATHRANRGAHWGYYYVTRSTVCPAVLFEAGFMVNPHEYENITDETQLWVAGDAIARGILACVPEA